MDKSVMTEEQFCITVEYDKSEPNPEKIFLGIAKLIEGLQMADEELAMCIDSEIKPLILLEDVEHGSIKMFFKSFLESIPDEGLKTCDIKRIVGEFLVKGKHLFISYMGDKNEPEKNEIIELEEKIKAVAKETGVSELDCYTTPSRKGILESMRVIGDGVKLFRDTDKITFDSGIETEQTVVFNKSFEITDENIDSICKSEEIINNRTMILKINKADFLGDSQWEFKCGTYKIKAKIIDEDWLELYRSGSIILKPGDSLKVRAEETIIYDRHNEPIRTKYQIIEVKAVLSDDFSVKSVALLQ